MTAHRPPHINGLLALSPAFVFLILYLGASLITGDFYSVPVSVALVAASVWSVIIFRGRSLQHRITVFSRAAGRENILYMVWVFVLAGAFATLAKGIGAIDATVRLTMMCCPAGFVLPAIFIAACIISMSVGTSVGTVVALTPLVVEFAEATDVAVPLYVAAVLGGAFFGDNLSFISDTTIAATRSQGCKMSDKFKANFRIALPAAIIVLAIYTYLGLDGGTAPAIVSSFTWSDVWLVLPYLLVIILALIGINVTVVLLSGIFAALACAIPQGLQWLEAARLIGDGIGSMSELIVITMLAAGMLGIITAAGGIDALLRSIARLKPGFRGAQGATCLITGAVNLCTANNTVAIITAGPLCRSIASKYDIAPRRSASLMDTSSCIMQCLIPYGAQTLLATGLAGISPAAPWQYLYYPWALLICLAIGVVISKKSRQ